MRVFRKRLVEAHWLQVIVGTLAAFYLRLVRYTTRFTVDPPDIYERIKGDYPMIVTMWHGQHFLMPFIKRAEHRVKVLISRHRDGAVNAIAAERLGVEAIRGSGDHQGRFDRKGGVGAFLTMVNALKEGYVVALTADVPKVSRVAGLGIVMLARRTGRPIYPVAIATSRRLELNNWDRSAVNLPFGRGAVVAGSPIRVPADTTDDGLEVYRQRVEDALNHVTEQAYATVDGSGRSTEGDTRRSFQTKTVCTKKDSV